MGEYFKMVLEEITRKSWNELECLRTGTNDRFF
jgi:hypothetical protein